MKKSVGIGLLVGWILLAMMISQITGETVSINDQSKEYATMIDEIISNCINKKPLLNSGSPNIRRQAVRACLKGAYLKLHKNELVAHLVSVNAKPGRHHIEYHLNRHFYKTLKPEKLWVLLEAGHLLKGAE